MKNALDIFMGLGTSGLIGIGLFLAIVGFSISQYIKSKRKDKE